jgi:hypothetical protein
VQKYGDDQKDDALNAAKALQNYKGTPPRPASLSEVLRLDQGQGGRLGVASDTARERSAVRDNVYKLIAQLKHAEEVKGITHSDERAKSLAKELGAPVEYAPGGCEFSAPLVRQGSALQEQNLRRRISSPGHRTFGGSRALGHLTDRWLLSLRQVGLVPVPS